MTKTSLFVWAVIITVILLRVILVKELIDTLTDNTQPNTNKKIRFRNNSEKLTEKLTALEVKLFMIYKNCQWMKKKNTMKLRKITWIYDRSDL